MISIRNRRLGIILAVVLGLTVFLYVGAVAGQVMEGYADWQAAGGLAGDTQIAPVNFNPLYCYSYAFTGSGLKGSLLVLVAAGAITGFVFAHNKFNKGDYDERNFHISKQGTYGTAGWLDDKEIKEVLEVTTPGKAQGTILGKKDGKVLCMPENTMLAKHMMVYGSTGSRKSRAVVRPLLFQACKRGESVICTDPKGEMYKDTSNMFRDNGYTVRVFAPARPDYSDSWNPMEGLEGDTILAQLMTDVIMRNTTGTDGKVDRFWDDNEGGLLKALTLYVDRDASRGPESKHLPAVYQLITHNNDKQLSAMFEKLPFDHPAKVPYNLFKDAPDNVKHSIVSGLGTRLALLQNPAICEILKRSDINLVDPGRKKCAYYIVMSDQDTSMAFLGSLFFSLLFMKLVAYADDQPNECCDVPVNIVLEELLTSCGYIMDLPIKFSSVRSRGLKICTVVQGLPQLQNRYPQNQWAEILTNCDFQIMLGCSDAISADYFSRRCGDLTARVDGSMTMRRTIAVAQVIPEYRATEGVGKRRLLDESEVQRLSHDQELVIIKGRKVILCEKFDYEEHPYAKKLQRTPLNQYVPQRAMAPARRQAASTWEMPTAPIIEPAPEIPRPLQRKARQSLYGSSKPPDEF